MSAYFIFAISLTVVYAVYFLTLIFLDLHAKSEDKENEAETFEVEQIAEEEQSVAVTESEGGFNVGGNEYEVSVASDSTSAIENSDDAQQNKRDKNAEILEKVKEQLANQVPVHSDGYEREQFTRCIMENHGIFSPKPNQKPNMKWLPVKDKETLDHM